MDLDSLSGSYRLSEVIEELEKQTGNIITTSRALATTIELDLKDVPFYLAFDKLLDQSGLDIEPYFAPHPNQVLIKPKLDGIAPAVNMPTTQVHSGLRPPMSP